MVRTYYRAFIVPAALLLMVAVSAPGAAQGVPPGVGIIVPGEGIGPLKLGMTPAQVRPLLDRLPCEIVVAYTDGRASRMETNCGVAYQTAEGITVGLDGSRIWWIHGPPDQAVPSNFAGTRADWLLYRGAGIGFRVIYAEGGTLIQAVSVFRSTGPPAVRRPPSPVPVVPPPVLGQ